MSTPRDLLRNAARCLSGDEARREAEILLAHVLDVGEAWLAAHAGDAIDEARVNEYRGLIERRARGEPVAYIMGIRGFYALDLAVTPDVLIPRPETELLVELALQRIPVDAESAVADLGTGSGAIALAIARARPRARVVASDASDDALEVARANAARFDTRPIEFVRGDWFSALGGRQFDVIVSNPPYIAEGDPHLYEGDLRFEPRAALAAGPDGLDAIRIIVAEAHAHLHPGGWLLFEHGFDQGAAVRALLAAHAYAGVFTERDLARHERVSGGRLA